jgi:hypothetical protein
MSILCRNRTNIGDSAHLVKAHGEPVYSTGKSKGQYKNLFCFIQPENLNETKLLPPDELDMSLFQTDLPETITYFSDKGHREFAPPEGYTPERKEAVR